MLSSETTYWLVCNVCRQKGPKAYTESAACDVAFNHGWTECSNPDKHYCPKCSDEHSDLGFREDES